MELGVIPPELFAPFVRERFESTGRHIGDDALASVLEITRGHPYGTQELCYALWEVIRGGGRARLEDVDEALAHVLRAESAHFRRIWEGAPKAQRLVLDALAREPGRPLASEYRRRHRLPTPSTVQRALAALTADELVARDDAGYYRIVEPFLAEWIRRDIG
jgi:hypothetical protein